VDKQYKGYKVLGLMSGTSRDGLDICLTEFYQDNENWEHELLAAETIEYESELEKLLLESEDCSSPKLIQNHFRFGHYLGDQSRIFLKKYDLEADLIASHGHTIFHQIQNGYTFQLGHGAAIAASSGLKVISDFRSLDVALGGEGAPLVPFGDMHLFDQYDACINIGGIANISFQSKSKMIAYDIVPANMVLNHICQNELNQAYDIDGRYAREGNIDEALLTALNSNHYYLKEGPKSLEKEWIFKEVIPIIDRYRIHANDKLRTYCEHIRDQIEACIVKNKINGRVLLSGGGVKNTFLTEILKNITADFELPREEIIDFKEAIIFGFLGLMRFLESPNTLKSVTGASKNSIGGSIFLP